MWVVKRTSRLELRKQWGHAGVSVSSVLSPPLGLRVRDDVEIIVVVRVTQAFPSTTSLYCHLPSPLLFATERVLVVLCGYFLEIKSSKCS